MSDVFFLTKGNERRHWFGSTESFTWEKACGCATPGRGECKFVEILDPGEWIEIGHLAVRTKSIKMAAGVAASAAKRTRQQGITATGVQWMCLALFRERLEAQRGRS